MNKPAVKAYDAAAAKLKEAREILDLNPRWKPAQERVRDALKRVVRIARRKRF